MMTRYCDRRQHIRVPAAGPVRWQSGQRTGIGQLVDISPGGAGVLLPLRKALQVGEPITLDTEDSTAALITGGVVVRRSPRDDGQCLLGIQGTK